MAIGRSAYDRFRGRLLWPIRDAPGDTIGFGARRIFDDDKIEAKYLNTPETRIYKKSQVLYGIDLARREIAKSSQAVIVEGYTDVMACHLAGVGTAVATCGTAFGDEHSKVLRRFLNDHEEFRGEVIFTFDGDAAGQKAAIRAFGGDQNFVSQTYVAVEPDGLDPCDVRIKKGDAAVRELVARRVPLYRFVLANIVGKYDLDRADGRIDALRESARLVSSIRDKSKVDAFAREIAGMIGVDIDEARSEVRRAANRRPSQDPRSGTPATEAPAPARSAVPDLRDPRFSLERETLKLVVQHPMTIGRSTSEIGPNDFTHPTYRAVWELVAAAGGPGAGAGDDGWANRLRDSATDPAVVVGDQRARGRAADEGAGRGVRRAARLPADGAHHRPPDRRDQVQAAAHQPGRAGRRVQQDVRRAGRPRGAPPSPARPARRAAAVSPFRRDRPPIRVERGERLLADAAGEGALVGGTRDALYVVRSRGGDTFGLEETVRIPWEEVQAADWDQDSSTLRVTEVGTWGEERPDHRFTLDDAGAAAPAGPRAGHRQHRAAAARPGRRPPRGPRDRPPGAARRPAGRVALRVRRGRRPRRSRRPPGRRGGSRGRAARGRCGLNR